MGCAIPFADDMPFEEKVKCMADEELLEIWVESQQIEHMLNAELPQGCVISPNYERAIINELTARVTRRFMTKNSSSAC